MINQLISFASARGGADFKIKMMKYLLNIFLFPSTLFAQTTVRGIIVNSNRDPLAYTNIVALNKRVGTVTNEIGAFRLSNMLPEDSLKISTVGFIAKVMAVKELVGHDTIWLTENVQQLDAVVIENLAAYKQERNIGYTDYPKNGTFTMGPGDQLATYIPNQQDKEGWIKGVSFKVKTFGKCDNSMRVRVLQMDPLHFMPAEDLLAENVIVTPGDLKKSTYVDLSSYRLVMPKAGVFVVLEWIYPDRDCDQHSYTAIASNFVVQDNIVWFNFRDKAWSHDHRPRLPNGNYNTPNVGLRVAY